MSIADPRPARVDYSALSAEEFESLVREYLVSLGMDVSGLGRGADDGKDLLAVERLASSLGTEETHTTLVQCKHHRDRAIAASDLDDVVTRCHQHRADTFLLVCSGVVSSALVRMQEDFASRSGPRFVIWDGVELARRIRAGSDPNLLDRFLESPRTVARPIARKTDDAATLGEEIRKTFSLRAVLTCDAPTGGASLYEALGAEAAQYFVDQTAQNSVVGISCGRTIFELANHIPPISRRVRIYPISFNVGPTLTDVMSPWATIFRMCEQVSGATGYEIPLPAFVADPALELPVYRQRMDIWEELLRSREPSIAFYSVGHLEAGSSYDWAAERLKRIMPGFSATELRTAGACGEINWYPFSAAGEIVEHRIQRHGLSMNLSEIRRLASDRHRQMVLVAGGSLKALPIAAALKGGFLNVLITDRATLTEVARLL